MEPLPGPYNVDLWVLDLDTIDPDLMDRYRALMSDDERDQEQRLRFPGGRDRYCCTRALARTAFSCYTGVLPHEWVFASNAYGKPSIARPAGVALRFNLSHSGRLIVCAVTGESEVGVDVEQSRELPKARDLARRFFAPSEAAVVDAAPPDRRSPEFLRFWTFKESYVKARGVGLRVPLDGFFFMLSPDAPPAIGFTAPENDDAEAWQFAEIRYADSYQVALAVRRARTEPLNISVRRTVPLCRVTQPQPLPPTPLRRWAISE